MRKRLTLNLIKIRNNNFKWIVIHNFCKLTVFNGFISIQIKSNKNNTTRNVKNSCLTL